MIDRRLIQNIDWALMGLLVLNSLIGVLVIYSASQHLPGHYYLRQLIFIGVSLIALLAVLVFDYQVLVDYAYYIYGFVAIVLVGMVVFNHLMKKGSWIRMAHFQVQPSELAKIALVLALARLFAEYKRSSLTRGAALAAAGLAAVPFLLVALQPDLGTAVSLLSILAGALILAGLERKTIIAVILLVIGVSIAGWHFYLKDYQKERLTTVVFPGKDPRGSGYQVLQSKIAIGSGGVFGKGFRRGSQSQLKFLPARHTDFVFSVIGEEFGFAGAAVVLLIYYAFLWRLFWTAQRARDRTGVYIVFMVGLMMSFQLIINVFMVLGIFPVVGIPLPLLSYGGSSLLANYLGVGLVLNVKMRRFANI